jgi:hypothetical protein
MRGKNPSAGEKNLAAEFDTSFMKKKEKVGLKFF